MRGYWGGRRKGRRAIPLLGKKRRPRERGGDREGGRVWWTVTFLAGCRQTFQRRSEGRDYHAKVVGVRQRCWVYNYLERLHFTTFPPPHVEKCLWWVGFSICRPNAVITKSTTYTVGNQNKDRKCLATQVYRQLHPKNMDE